MCGFAGILDGSTRPVSQESLSRMALLLRHRGPDELCIARPAHGVGLAHARLKVIDLSEAARQPMVSQSGAFWLAYNGEIYNFKALRSDLEAQGCQFRSHSDTEVVLQAAETWGVEATLKRLDGMFALALWDTRSEQLWLARDRTGKKPLYFWGSHNQFLFASEIKALFAHPDVPRRFFPQSLPSLLRFGYPVTGTTAYEQIECLPPATFLTWSFEQGPSQPQRYWDLPQAGAQKSRSADQAIDELRYLLKQSVQKRLLADVPLGAFLSGGLDSSIVVALLASLKSSQKVKTFSIGFEGDPQFNETSYAEQVAQHFDTDHTSFVVTPESFELVEQLVSHHDQPFGDSSAVPAYLLSQLTRSQVTVALNGDGGDELFAGYDRFQAMLLADQIPAPVLQAGSLMLRGLPSGRTQRSTLSRIRRFLEVANQQRDQRYSAWLSLFQDPRELVIAQGLTSENWELHQAYQSLRSASSEGLLDQLLRLNFNEYLPNDLHVKMDRCSMAHGLETRSPFLDTKLIEWSFQLPSHLKLRQGTGKWILREAYRQELPRPILYRKKMGFGVPLATWFRGPWQAGLKEFLISDQARLNQYLNGDLVRKAAQEHLAGERDLGHGLWFLLTFEIWLRQLERSVDFSDAQLSDVVEIPASTETVKAIP